MRLALWMMLALAAGVAHADSSPPKIPERTGKPPVGPAHGQPLIDPPPREHGPTPVGPAHGQPPPRRPAVGVLRIEVGPPGATVLVDGKALPAEPPQVRPPGATVVDGKALPVLVDGKAPPAEPRRIEHLVPLGVHRVTLLRYPRRADFTVRVSGGEPSVLTYQFGTPPDPGGDVRVTFDRERRLSVDGVIVDRAEAALLLASAASSGPKVRVVIAADQSLPHAEVVSLMDLVRGAGIKKIAMAVSQAR